MAILERHVHTLTDVKAFWEREKQFKQIEDRLTGFPPKRYYYLMSGQDNTGTIAHERQWESFGAMEAAYDKLFAEAGVMDLGGSGSMVGNTERTEYYYLIDEAE